MTVSPKSTPTPYTLGVIGGSGLYEMEGLTNVESVAVETPFGSPSDPLVRGVLEGPTGPVTLLFLPRHGRGHRFSPTDVPYRANVFAMKAAGATHLLSVSAVGSMKEAIEPGDLVAVDQFIDLTKRRISTFFDDGAAAHVTFADPVCDKLQGALVEAAKAATESVRASGGKAGKVHVGGTYVCMEGPQFSTRAESLVYRTWGVSVIGMTAMPEAKLAREAELPYATLALATDYDCWHQGEEDVSVDAVVAVLSRNVATARKTVRELAFRLPDPATSRAAGALRHAIMTSKDRLTESTKARLAVLAKER